MANTGNGGCLSPFGEDFYVLGCLFTALTALFVVAVEMTVIEPDASSELWIVRFVSIGSLIVALFCLLETSPSFRHARSTRGVLSTLSIATRGTALGFAIAMLWNDMARSQQYELAASVEPNRHLQLWPEGVAWDLLRQNPPTYASRVGGEADAVSFQTTEQLSVIQGMPQTILLDNDVLTDFVFDEVTDREGGEANRSDGFTNTSDSDNENTVRSLRYGVKSRTPRAQSPVPSDSFDETPPDFDQQPRPLPDYLDAVAAFAIYSACTGLLSFSVTVAKSDHLHAQGYRRKPGVHCSFCRQICCCFGCRHCCKRLWGFVFSVTLSIVTELSISLLVFAHLPQLAPFLVVEDQIFEGPPKSWGPLCLLDTSRGLSAVTGLTLSLFRRAKASAVTHALLMASLLAHLVCTVVSGWQIGLTGSWAKEFPRLLTFETAETMSVLTFILVLIHSRYVFKRYQADGAGPSLRDAPDQGSSAVMGPVASSGSYGTIVRASTTIPFGNGNPLVPTTCLQCPHWTPNLPSHTYPHTVPTTQLSPLGSTYPVTARQSNT